MGLEGREKFKHHFSSS